MKKYSILLILIFSLVSCHHDNDNKVSLPEATIDTDFRNDSSDVVELGRLLFFDKELSGNRNISCSTCHSPLIATVDALSVNIGTGGSGLGLFRNAGNFPPTALDPKSRGLRNMTPLFNLGHKEFNKLFWDGRVQANKALPHGFDSPAGTNLPVGFTNTLDVLSIFAETDFQEMKGDVGTNELADAAVLSKHVGVWDALVTRLGAIPEYVQLFTKAFPEVSNNASNITIIHVGTALGAFQANAFRADDSQFDKFLKGDKSAMNASMVKGMKLFYGRAKCSECHSGVFQTDHDFYAIGIPQVGPGFGEGIGEVEDFGREGFTGNVKDRYRFKTPSLRNVALTGPWGHDGFYNSIEGIINHHLNPKQSLLNADPSQFVVPSRPDLDELDFVAFNNQDITNAISDAIEINPPKLTSDEVIDIISFLQSLTDVSSLNIENLVPNSVPSGLSLED